MWGDDLAKMPHMARIAGSVYSDIDPSLYHSDREGYGTHTPILRVLLVICGTK